MTTARDRLIEKYRYMNVDGGYDWWDSIEEDLRSDMKAIGFTVAKMYFSGFWSQGDGACFTGGMHNWKLFCDKVPEFVRDFPYLSEYLKDEGANYTVAHRGHYYHEDCTSHEYYDDLEYYDELKYGLDQLDDNDIDDMDPEALMRYGMYKQAMSEGDVGAWLKDYFKDKMRELYRDLEEEYDYLTSDEAVWESIVANELDKELEDEDEAVSETSCALHDRGV